MLTTIQQAAKLIADGNALIVAGEEELLQSLRAATGLAGRIPYFMTEHGGVTSREQLFIEQVPAIAVASRIRIYNGTEIAQVGVNAPERGYSLLIIPAFSRLHHDYALHAPHYPELFFKVIAGWIAGVHLDDVNVRAPAVFHGPSGAKYTQEAVALEVQLPADHAATLGIVNIFEQGAGDQLVFTASGFAIDECLVNGVRHNFHDYLLRVGVDVRLPLIADFCGTMINVGIQSVDAKTRRVQLYAPVFEDVIYRFAKPIGDYSACFAAAIPAHVRNPAFACNCVLNYLYGSLEGRSAGAHRRSP
ncbi:MAG: hypothetical protein HC872_05310 [Gammaproteobacteria bacterium]|nr:hypothetical protein [Gammaproteobacteria bacterium]